ncbi:MAG TPA: hypothetical protein VJ926_00200 [Patescibacteria group bacterium]|nr:hypothetical protein [Patescibacteria group bacterium]
MNKIKKENVIVLSGAMFTMVALLHLLRLITGSELLVAGFNISIWLSLEAVILTGLLAFFNLNLIEKKTKVFWLKYVLALVIFDALIALFFLINNLTFLGISPNSFSFIFIFDAVLILVLFYYINKIKSLHKK